MKKKDIYLICMVLAVALITFGLYKWLETGEPECVRVTVDGEEFGVYKLADTQTIHINDTNVLEIKGGKADMIQADCPDQICVNQKSISKNGETITCLPNKVQVRVISTKKSYIDSVSN